MWFNRIISTCISHFPVQCFVVDEDDDNENKSDILISFQRWCLIPKGEKWKSAPQELLSYHQSKGSCQAHHHHLASCLCSFYRSDNLTSVAWNWLVNALHRKNFFFFKISNCINAVFWKALHLVIGNFFTCPLQYKILDSKIFPGSFLFLVHVHDSKTSIVYESLSSEHAKL